MNESIECLACDSSHIGRLIALGGTYYPPGSPALVPSYLDWFYLQNPVGRAMLCVATEGGKWIGVIVFIPVLLEVDQRKQDAYFAVNVLTHPQHRTKNLFVKMIKASSKVLARRSVWLLGHPNANAAPGWSRQKMQFRAPLVPRLTRPGAPWKALHRVRVYHRADLVDFFNHSMAASESYGGIRLNYSPEFIEWRYLKSPIRKYVVTIEMCGGEPAGLRVCRRFKGPIDLLVDFVGSRAMLPVVLRSSTTPALLFFPEAGLLRKEVDAATWRLPVSRRLPFFLTDWSGATAWQDSSGITLGASDF